MSKLLIGIFTALAWLPFWALYLLSDVSYYLIYYIIRYRRRVVRDNLAQCFPEKSEGQRRQIEKQFYKNFADYTIETIKLLHISDDEMRRRMQFHNTELMDRLIEEGKSIVIYFGHIGNWEWAPSVTLHTHPQTNSKIAYGQLYRPLRSKVFDDVMLKIRSRFGTTSIPKAISLRTLLQNKRAGKISVTGFMSDQKPSHGDPTVPLRFLERPTAFISGTETLARKLDMAVIYWDTEKTSRGHYQITCRLMADNAANTKPTELTAQYANLLQNSIRRNPSIWLWTHKRWKIPVDPSSLLY